MFFSVVWLHAHALVDCDAKPTDVSAQGVHLAYAGDASSAIAISFFTCGAPADNATLPLATFESGVQVTGTSRSYYSRWHHDIVVDELEAGRTHEYTVQLGKSGTPSAAFSFATSPRTEGAFAPFGVVVVGDMGVNNSDATIARIAALTKSGQSNATVHVGDIGYGDDHAMKLEPSSGRAYEAVYDLFQAKIEAVASAAPYMVCPGNHDVSCHVLGDTGCPEQQRNFSAFRNRFDMPSLVSNATDDAGRSVENLWYSFTVAGIHMVSISTESDFSGAPTTPKTLIGGGKGGGFGDQLAWLERDLARARASRAVQFIVVYGHRPWYASKTSDWPLNAPKHIQAAFEPLFARYRVDVYMCGHKHYYERVARASGGKANAVNGTTMIITGAAGNNEGLDEGKGVGGLIVAANYKDEGFGLLDLINATALRWRYISSASGALVDEAIFASRAPARKSRGAALMRSSSLRGAGARARAAATPPPSVAEL